MKKNIQIALRVSKPVKDSLQRAADMDNRSLSNLVNKIVTEWVDANKVNKK